MSEVPLYCGSLVHRDPASKLGFIHSHAELCDEIHKYVDSQIETCMVLISRPFKEVGLLRFALPPCLQGYLAHEKDPPSVGPP